MYFNIFPTVILKKNLDNHFLSKIESYKDYINSLPLVKGDIKGICTVEQRLLNNFLFSDLKYQILKYSKEYLNELGDQFEDIQIASSWAAKPNKGISGAIHNHVNSYLSGVYYLTEGSDIEFLNPLTSLWNFHAIKNQNLENPRTFRFFSITPTVNSLILFPSFLSHYICPPKDDKRISIAFNIIPKGEFGDITRKIYLS